MKIRIYITIAFVLMTFSSINHASERFSGEDIDKEIDKFIEQLRKNKSQITEHMLLYQEGALFILKLQSIEALADLKSTTHGEINSTFSKKVTFKDVYPFEDNYLLTIEGDLNIEYLYSLIKKNEKAPWQLSVALKRNIKLDEYGFLPLPSSEHQLEANRLLKEAGIPNGN